MSTQLRAGYKLTDAGAIPEDWEVANLGEHATFRTGPFGSALHKSDYTVAGVPVINPMHIVDGQIFPTPTMTITEQAAESLADFRMKLGEVVIGRRGDMGRCAVVQQHQHGWMCGTGSMIVRPGKSFDAAFLQRVLSSPKIVAAIEDTSVGSTMINLNQGVLARLKLQLPPLVEQRYIASALSDMDALISGLDQLIEKKREMKQAAMQRLLTGQQRLLGFNDQWGLAVLGNLLTMKATYGIVTAGDFQSSGVPMMRGGDIKGGQIGHDLPYVTHEKSAEYSRTVIKQDDVVISLVGYPGEAAKVPARLQGANISRAVGLLRPNKLVVPDYLVSYLNSPIGRRMVLAPSAGSAQLVVNLMALNKLEFPLPPRPEQAAIATILCDMDNELITLETRRNKARQLKQGMTQKLLTGKIRLSQ